MSLHQKLSQTVRLVSREVHASVNNCQGQQDSVVMPSCVIHLGRGKETSSTHTESGPYKTHAFFNGPHILLLLSFFITVLIILEKIFTDDLAITNIRK